MTALVIAAVIAGAVLFVAVLHRVTAHPVQLSKPLDGARDNAWNAWRFPTGAEQAAGRDPWDLIFVGSAAYPEDAREMLPEEGGQVQEGLTGPVTSYVNEDHELAVQERKRAQQGKRA